MRLHHTLPLFGLIWVLALSLSACRAVPSQGVIIDGTGAWPMEGYSPSRSRYITQTLPLPLSAPIEYKLPDPAPQASPVTIANGLIFAEGNHQLSAIRLNGGKEQWRLNVPGSFLSPAVADGVVYIRAEQGEEGYVYALTADQGRKLWQYKFAKVGSSFNNVGGHVTSPVVVDGLVLVGAAQSLVALDAKTGEERWSFSTDYPIASSAAVADGVVYIADFTHLYALSLQSGAEGWRFQHEKIGVYFAPIVLGDQVALAGEDTIYVLDRQSGKSVWSQSFANLQVIPAGASPQHLYVKSTKQLWALDRKDGKIVWDYAATNYVSLPVITADQIYVITRADGGSQLRVLQMSDGKELWRQDQMEFANSAPVVAGNGVYVRTSAGNVLLFRSS